MTLSGLGNADTDWQDEIFRTAVSTNHNLSIQGGLKDMPYRIGLGFEDNNGIVKTSWMKRFNTSVNLAPFLPRQALELQLHSEVYVREGPLCKSW